MGNKSEEATPQQENGLCNHSQLCVGHTSGKLPDNIVTGVTVLMTLSVTCTLPFKVRHLCKLWRYMHVHNVIILCHR